MDFATIVNYITSSELQKQLLLVKIVFFVFGAFFISVFIVLLSKTEWLRAFILRDIIEFFSQKARLVGRLAKQWEKIKSRLEVGTESELKLSILEADSLIEEVLQDMGYLGETLEERLKKAPPTIVSDVPALLQAHQIRNNIVHDPDYHLTLEQARQTLAIYEKALRDIEAL